MDTGWIKLYRKLLEDVIWIKSTNEQRVILVALLLMANHKSKEWEWGGKKFEVLPGQFITSIDNIMQVCKGTVSVKNIRTALSKFEKLGFLTNESTKTGRLITIVKWDFYQGENSQGGKDTGKEVADNRQRTGKEVAPNKNDKNVKNDKNIYAQQVEQLWSLYPNKKGKATAIKKIPKLIEKYGYEQLVCCIERYKEGLQQEQWRKPQNGSTFFNSGYVDYLDKNYQKVSRDTPLYEEVLDPDTGEVIRVSVGG